jgi:hypothetical protein
MKSSVPSSFLGLKESVNGTYIDVFTNTDGRCRIGGAVIIYSIKNNERERS